MLQFQHELDMVLHVADNGTEIASNANLTYIRGIRAEKPLVDGGIRPMPRTLLGWSIGPSS